MDNVSVHIIRHLTGSPPQTHHSSSPQKFAPPYHTHVCTNNLSQQWLVSKLQLLDQRISQIHICKRTQDKGKLLLLMFSPYCFTCYQETYLPNVHMTRGSSTGNEAVLLVTFASGVSFHFCFMCKQALKSLSLSKSQLRNYHFKTSYHAVFHCSLVPRLRSAFCRLQYRKPVRAWERG